MVAGADALAPRGQQLRGASAGAARRRRIVDAEPRRPRPGRGRASLAKSADAAGRGRVDHQRADRRRRRRRHRQARRRPSGDPAPRPAVHGARRRRRAAAGGRCRRLRARQQPGRRLVRRAAGVGPTRGGDRLQLCARRHRDRPVRARRRRQRCAYRATLPPAHLRLLLVAQLREPADRPQAGVLHADAAARRRARAVAAVARRCAAGTATPTRRASSASCRPRACTAPTTSSIRASRWRCTPSPSCELGAAPTALRIHRGARPGRPRVLRVAGLGLRVDQQLRRRHAAAVADARNAAAASSRVRCRPCSAFRSTAPRRARSRPPACRSTRCRSSRTAAAT